MEKNMKIDNEELSRLYQEESGKLLLGLNSNRFNQYVQIINKSFYDSMTNYFSKGLIRKKHNIILYSNQFALYLQII